VKSLAYGVSGIGLNADWPQRTGDWMKKLVAWAAIAAALTTGATAHAEESALAWANRYVLVMSTVDEDLAPIVSGIAHDPSLRDSATCDLLAEVLLRLQARKIVARKSGPLILLVLSGAPAPGRYRSIMEGLGKYLSQPDAKAYLLAYRRRFSRATDAQYEPGSIDLDALRRDYVAAAWAATPTQAQATALGTLTPSSTMDELFARAGRPAHVVANAMTPASHVIDIEFREVWFLYRGIGRVRFNYLHADSRWHFIDVLADPLAFEGFMPYRGESAQVSLADADALGIAQLASGNPASIRNSVMAAFERGKPSLEYLDTAAELLLRRYEEIGNSPAVDTYGWICNLLSELGGTRYSRVLATVQKRSKDEKLAHYAGRHNGASSGPWTEPYVPGFISLTEQARKYPSPYPEITLLRETK
jgi:hypothetical protein